MHINICTYINTLTKFSLECKEVPFLDVLVKLENTQVIYYKPTDTHQYLLHNICHSLDTKITNHIPRPEENIEFIVQSVIHIDINNNV